jgi:hypothetical protein
VNIIVAVLVVAMVIVCVSIFPKCTSRLMDDGDFRFVSRFPFGYGNAFLKWPCLKKK